MPKKQVGFRLDEKLIFLLDYMGKLYPRMNSTDIADMALKKFCVANLWEHVNGHTEDLDQMIGEYMRGELDEHVQMMFDDLKKDKNPKKTWMPSPDIHKKKKYEEVRKEDES